MTPNSHESAYPALVNHRGFLENVQNLEYSCSVYQTGGYRHNLVLVLKLN